MCKIHKCFDTPQLYPMDMKRVDCPITVCEFAAGLHRPKFDPLVPDPPNLTKRSVKRNGEEIEVPFHERYMAGKRCYAGSWALRQSTDRKAPGRAAVVPRGGEAPAGGCSTVPHHEGPDPA